MICDSNGNIRSLGMLSVTTPTRVCSFRELQAVRMAGDLAFIDFDGIMPHAIGRVGGATYLCRFLSGWCG